MCNWLQAFSVLGCIMGQKHPERCSELFIYMDLVYNAGSCIQLAVPQGQWPSVVREPVGSSTRDIAKFVNSSSHMNVRCMEDPTQPFGVIARHGVTCIPTGKRLIYCVLVLLLFFSFRFSIPRSRYCPIPWPGTTLHSFVRKLSRRWHWVG